MAGYNNPPYYISAYAMAVQGGYTGAEEEFSAALAGLADTLRAMQEQIDGIMAGMVPEGSITTPKLALNAVTHPKLASDAVEAGNIKNGEVTHPKLASDAVEAGNVKNGEITHPKLALDAVEAGNVKDGELGHVKTDGTIQAQHSTAQATVPAITAGGTQTVNVTGVTESNTVFVEPAPASFLKWRDCGVRCSAQGDGTLTFTAESATGEALTANVAIFGVNDT